MAMTLPPSIRPYWSTLTAEKSVAAAHQAWEWSADPFEARKEVDERQTKRKEKEEGKMNGDANTTRPGSGTVTPRGRSGQDGVISAPGGKAWEDVPEVRMAPGLREMVEGVVRKVSSLQSCEGGTDGCR